MTRPLEVLVILAGACWLDGATRTLANLLEALR